MPKVILLLNREWRLFKQAALPNLGLFVFGSVLTLFLVLYNIFVSGSFSFADGSYFPYMKILFKVVLSLFLVGYFIYLIVVREKRPIRQFGYLIKSVITRRYYILSSLLLFYATGFFLSAFSTAKGAVYTVGEFAWDSAFSEMDRLLFFGKDAWHFFDWLYQYPVFIMLLNLFYNVWLFAVLGVFAFFCFQLPSRVRNTYLYSWLACWVVLGVVCATLFSSAGPAFFSRVHPGLAVEPYQDLMERLRSIDAYLIASDYPFPLWALSTQDWLYNLHVEQSVKAGAGISAMPSMHVSMAVLMALGLTHVQKWIGIIFWLYAFIIYIGSFLLAWHYAVDGIVSFILTLLVWYVVGLFVKNPKRVSPYQ
ncbi:phosphatase PAP2 family protein [Salinivibrio sp. ES.052]|uniref:phosphatase PAP2 family protein n=1 Tax=Salinivibrio sp. ES.052 TaxID=1882823 RepID=UPI00092A380D|nr:phosphatase PAP2 family protein [Salinivibrio sp. ES.052]SIN72806.1 PAP2 superfamily protein [Salinivibrio sp. ES.052]